MRAQRTEKRLQRRVSWLCASIFAIFSFTFTAVYQAPLLEVLYDKVATGKLQFNPYICGGCITFLLTLLAFWLNRFAAFKREWVALSYLPSCLLLAFITDIDSSIYVGGKNSTAWLWIFIVGFALYFFTAFLLKRVLFAQIKNIQMEGNRIVWRNMMLFTILFCMTGWLSNSEENFKYEAAAYCHYKHGDTDAALNVASRSLTASPHITYSRAFYMAKAGKLGDKLFTYPQYYGVDGLLPFGSQASPLSPDTVYALFGAGRNEGEGVVDYLHRALQRDSVPSRLHVDYYLSSLLLDKRLPKFVEELPRYYNVNDGAQLPLHYKEALMYYATVLGDYDLPFDADTMRSELLLMGLFRWNYGEELPQHYKDAFRDYALTGSELGKIMDVDSLGVEFAEMLKLEKKYPELHIRSNYIRKMFGHTYWWYYSYSE